MVGLARRRTIVGLLALAATVLGLTGAYSYGEAYWQHRGFAPVVRLRHARIGHLLTIHFYSPALHRRSDYLVYLPPGYSRRRRYAVYYLLHGAPGGPRDFISVVGLNIRLSNSLSEHQLRPMILVMPDGRINGDVFSDSEWANTPAGNYESYVLNVVRDVDRRFATIRSRQARVIAGYSAGGYGALNIALHHLHLFANVQSWSGYFVQTSTSSRVFAHTSFVSLLYNSPLEYAQVLQPSLLERYPLRVYMFTGRRDPDGRQIGAMATELRRAGAATSYNVFPGGHDWQVWYARVDAMMLLASRMVSRPRGPQHARPIPASAPPTAPSLPAGLEPSPLAAAALLAPHHLSARSVLSARRPASRRSTLGLGASALLGLALAIVSAALINLGFLLQQRGLDRGRAAGARGWLAVLRNRTWLAGQALGWFGFGLQIVAVALAPLSLVQAFAAGGLALSVPLAAVIFGQRVPRLQGITVAVMASGLVALPLGVPTAGAGAANAWLIALAALGLSSGAVIATTGGAMAQALGAGILYGVADAAVKAVDLGVKAHGMGGVLSGATVLACGATFAGFVSFQASLRRGNGVSAIALMTSLATLTALVFGLAAFHESLGSAPGLMTLHLGAIALVLACVPLLAGAGLDADGDARILLAGAPAAVARLAQALRAGVGTALAATSAVVAGTGLLYGLRGFGWLAIGPRIRDALPLLQLAGFDAQPLARVAAAWMLAGAAFGVMLSRLRLRSRVIAAAGLGLPLLLLASDCSYAVARNMRMSEVLAGRVPGWGAWAEAALLAAGAALAHRGWSLRMPREILAPVLRARAALGAPPR